MDRPWSQICHFLDLWFCTTYVISLNASFLNFPHLILNIKIITIKWIRDKIFRTVPDKSCLMIVVMPCLTPHSVEVAPFTIHEDARKNQDAEHSCYIYPGIGLWSVLAPWLSPPLIFYWSQILPLADSWVILTSGLILSVHAQLCLTLCDPMDGSPPGSSVHEIFQTRIMEKIAVHPPGDFSQPRDQTQVSCVLLHWQANSFTTEPPGKAGKILKVA